MFSSIPASSVNADSPVDEILMTQLKDNDDALFAADVTNGNLHDHVAGDGASIPISGGLDIVIQSEGSETVPTISTWTPTKGGYNFIDDSISAPNFFLELYIDSMWLRSGTPFSGGVVFCDGANMRFYNSSGLSRDISYQKF